MSKSTFYCLKIGEWSYGCAAVMKHSHSWVVKMLKMGSSGHRDSTQGVYAWKVVEADERWGRPNAITAHKTRTTTSSVFDLSCLAASLSAGHHEERLFGWPLWPLCGFKFHFEERLVPSNSLMRKRIQKALAPSKAHLFSHFIRKIGWTDRKLRFSLIFFPTTAEHDALRVFTPTLEGSFLSVEMPLATVEALKSGTEVLHRDFGKHRADFLTVLFVYRADRPQSNRKVLVCVWSIKQKFVKHKVVPNEAFTRASALLWSPQPHLGQIVWICFKTAKYAIQFVDLWFKASRSVKVAEITSQ